MKTYYYPPFINLTDASQVVLKDVYERLDSQLKSKQTALKQQIKMDSSEDISENSSFVVPEGNNFNVLQHVVRTSWVGPSRKGSEKIGLSKPKSVEEKNHSMSTSIRRTSLKRIDKNRSNTPKEESYSYFHYYRLVKFLDRYYSHHNSQRKQIEAQSEQLSPIPNHTECEGNSPSGTSSSSITSSPLLSPFPLNSSSSSMYNNCNDILESGFTLVPSPMSISDFAQTPFLLDKVKLPYKISHGSLLSLGEIRPYPAYVDRECIIPVGYVFETSFYSMVHDKQKTKYKCSIKKHDKLERPVFVVEPEDIPGKILTGDSPMHVWTQIYNGANKVQSSSMMRMRGNYYFALRNEYIMALTTKLPGADTLIKIMEEKFNCSGRWISDENAVKD